VNPQIRSFDVFDTVLTRTFAAPSDLFVALGEEAQRRGLLKVAPQEFALRRMAAESAARQESPSHEPELADIYALLARDLQLSPPESERVAELELQTEEAALRPVPGMCERVAEARRAVGRVLFLSDMYLPSAFLERVLAKHGVLHPGDQLYVSGCLKASKASGQLYSRLLAELKVSPEQWLHVGDNPKADEAVPKQFGIATQRITEVALNRYEALARGEEAVALVWRSRLAAAMRLARLEGGRLPETPRVIWSTGADVVGPLLFGFVYWCLVQARQRGIRRLYFVARDGQVLHRIAGYICSAWGLEIQCRYLYGSRQAWRVPALTGVGSQELEWASPSDHDLSVENVCARLGLQPRQIQPLLLEHGFPTSGWREPLSEGRLAGLREMLGQEPVQQLVKQAADRARPRLMSYLKQEGFFEGEPFALVDLGWAGNLQRSLSTSLSLAGYADAARLTGLYFGLRPGTIIPAGQVMLEYSGCLARRSTGWMLQSGTMLEAFTSADHGSVSGYESRDGKVFPTLAEPENSAVLDWGLRSLQSAIDAFARNFLAASGGSRPLPEAMRAVTHGLFERFYRQPQPKEAAVWGAFPLRGQAIENIRGQLVPHWSTRQVIQAILDYRRRPHGWWMEGTLAERPSLALWLFLKLRGWRDRPAHRQDAEVDSPLGPSQNAAPGA
jgi:FMN phosphatase YigB (HAD superfamily)